MERGGDTYQRSSQDNIHMLSNSNSVELFIFRLDYFCDENSGFSVISESLHHSVRH